MTVTSDINRNDYLGNGATTAFPYTFKIFADTDLIVTDRDTDGAETPLVLGVDYTVTGVLEEGGGNVNLTVALPGDGSEAGSHKLNISRAVPSIQSSDLTSQGTVRANIVERALDRMTMLAQQLEDKFSRTISIPITDTNVSMELPAKDVRASTQLICDADGNVTTGNAPASGVISSAMQPVTSAATLAAGRAAMGTGYCPEIQRDDGTGWLGINMAGSGFAPTGEVEWLGTGGPAGQFRMKLVGKNGLTDYVELALVVNEGGRRTYGCYWQVKPTTANTVFTQRWNNSDNDVYGISCQYRHFGIGTAASANPGVINGTRLADTRMHISGDVLNLDSRTVIDGFNSASLLFNNSNNTANTRLLNVVWNAMHFKVQRWSDAFSVQGDLIDINANDGRCTHLGALCDASKTIVVATNGGSVTMADSQRTIVLAPATLIAGFTIGFPSNPQDGQEICVCAGAFGITTLTLSYAGKTATGTISTLAAGAFASWIYHAAGSVWYRCG